MQSTPALLQALAPTGTLRAAINLSNPVLANLAPGAAQPHGISVDLAQEFGRRLGVPVELDVFDSPAKSVAAVEEGRADFGFFAIDPARGAHIAFTAAYVLIEGGYLVRNDSPLQHCDEVDKPGRTVVVGKGSAYDLFLSREIRHATLERTASTGAVLRHFLDHGFDVAAGVKAVLEAQAARTPGVRILAGHFMVIQQAMGLAKARGAEAAALLAHFVEEMKSSGFVQQSMSRHGIEGAKVAPLR